MAKRPKVKDIKSKFPKNSSEWRKDRDQRIKLWEENEKKRLKEVGEQEEA